MKKIITAQVLFLFLLTALIFSSCTSDTKKDDAKIIADLKCQAEKLDKQLSDARKEVFDLISKPTDTSFTDHTDTYLEDMDSVNAMNKKIEQLMIPADELKKKIDVLMKEMEKKYPTEEARKELYIEVLKEEKNCH